MPASSSSASRVRYEADGAPPAELTLGLALQFVMLAITSIVITPAIVVRAANMTESYAVWTAFAALLVSGIATAVQAIRVRRVGAGYILMMGASGTFIAVCATALAEGGTELLASLIIGSSLFQILFATRLSMLRRIITPTVAGTVIMLISVSMTPVAFDLLTDVPADVPRMASPYSALATVAATLIIILRGSDALRLWSPVIGIFTGCVVGSFYGIYDFDRVASASWIGLPTASWPGFGFDFGPAFWSLLPAFVFVSLVVAIETVGASVAIQHVSWRQRRATDYRAVQGAVEAYGFANVLAGILATVPNTAYSSSAAVTEVTGVAARRIGIFIGIFFIALSSFPKIAAFFLAIPNPVSAVYVFILMAILFAVGMKIVVKDGMDYRKATIVGVSFWVGAGFQSGSIFPGYLGEWWGELLGNGLVAGGLIAIVLTGFMELTRSRSQRIQAALNVEALPKINSFLADFANRRKWGSEMAGRMQLVAEETLLTLVERGQTTDEGEPRRLLLIAKADGDAAEIEFKSAAGDGNLEDRMALLGEQTLESPPEHEISLRLLRHIASSVRHQQYNDGDIVAIRVEGSKRRSPEAALAYRAGNAEEDVAAFGAARRASGRRDP